MNRSTSMTDARNKKSMLVSDRAGTVDVFPPYAGKDPAQLMSQFAW